MVGDDDALPRRSLFLVFAMFVREVATAIADSLLLGVFIGKHRGATDRVRFHACIFHLFIIQLQSCSVYFLQTSHSIRYV
jgi:hypothetical protein